MKNLLLFLVLTVLLTACDKEPEYTYDIVKGSRWQKWFAEYELEHVELGTYHEWAEPIYTYKSYNGEPPIESDEFYNNLNGCSVWYTPYDNITDRKMLKGLANDGDSMAMLRLAMLADHNSDEYWQYLTEAKNLGNLNALILYWEKHKMYQAFDNATGQYTLIGPYYDRLIKYSEHTPLAALIFTYDLDRERISLYDRIKIYKILRKAGNDPYIMAYSAYGLYKASESGNMEDLEEVDKDNLCEAYFRGCFWLHEFAIGLKCGERANAN